MWVPWCYFVAPLSVHFAFARYWFPASCYRFVMHRVPFASCSSCMVPPFLARGCGVLALSGPDRVCGCRRVCWGLVFSNLRPSSWSTASSRMVVGSGQKPPFLVRRLSWPSRGGGWSAGHNMRSHLRRCARGMCLCTFFHSIFGFFFVIPIAGSCCPLASVSGLCRCIP